jgi:hypothetical protein
MILCSECFDKLERVRFTEIIPRADCARCGRLCLGYVTEPDDDAHDNEPIAKAEGRA